MSAINGAAANTTTTAAIATVPNAIVLFSAFTPSHCFFLYYHSEKNRRIRIVKKQECSVMQYNHITLYSTHIESVRIISTIRYAAEARHSPLFYFPLIHTHWMCDDCLCEFSREGLGALSLIGMCSY